MEISFPSNLIFYKSVLVPEIFNIRSFNIALWHSPKLITISTCTDHLNEYKNELLSTKKLLSLIQEKNL